MGKTTRLYLIDRFGRVWPNNPPEFCEKCGQPDSCGDCNHRPLTKAEMRELGGRQSCLGHNEWRFPMTVTQRHWNALTPVVIKRWRSPEPRIHSVKDVRSLRICVYCRRQGTSLALPNGKKGEATHVYCLVRERGTEILWTLPASELGKITFDEIMALGMKDTFMDLWETVKHREEVAAKRKERA